MGVGKQHGAAARGIEVLHIGARWTKMTANPGVGVTPQHPGEVRQPRVFLNRVWVCCSDGVVSGAMGHGSLPPFPSPARE